MSDVISTGSGPLKAAARLRDSVEPRKLPVGYGLAIGGLVSAGLWSAIIWAIARTF
ncbi:hypothetical protein [Phenylobacterium kunshanense]|uniref:hypothetical protein n=1 Tax=Phenylobacterium kunshanense TaxID=1445034 RepID=UPI0014020852|nr:hypothetical protein [Phenylobacterium kunshanense]